MKPRLWRYVLSVLLACILLSSPQHPRVASALSLPQLLLGKRGTMKAHPQHLLDCMNDAYEPYGTTWASAMGDKPAALKAVAAWWSEKVVDIPLTVVTQLSSNRLAQLFAQCKSWPGPLSAAVYQPLHQPEDGQLSSRNAYAIKKTLKALQQFHQSIEVDPTACSLDLIYVYEVYVEKRAMMLYPVNQLRNLARLQSRTELVGLMDVDMLVSSKLARSLQDSVNAALMVRTCNDKTVYVMPAFETYGAPEEAALQADKLIRQSKTFLVRSVGTGIIAPFDNKRFPIGHNATNFSRWYKADEQYSIKYSARYEPWIIVNRKAVPWHDVRFRGYGQNKIVHIAHTNASGFTFMVHPTGFIIHRAHEVTAARTQLVQDMKLDSELRKQKNERVGNNTIYGHSHRLWEEAKRAMDENRFVPFLDPATQRCLNKLDWW